MIYVKFNNTQETFDWLNANIEGWCIYDENMRTVEVEFSSEKDANYANEALNFKE